MLLARLARRIRLLARRDAVERAMDDELRHHLECEIAERVRGGMPPDEARRTAHRDFGSIEAIKEDSRDARGGRALDDLLLDVRYAVRVLSRNRSFTAAAVVTMALGIGAVTAIFSLVYGILLRPLPYEAPDRLVAIWERNIPRDVGQNVVSIASYEAWRDRSHSFEAMGAIVPTSITLPGDVPERLVGAETTPGYFTMLGVQPAAGRDFTEADAREGVAVILSHELWRRRFQSDPAIVGRAVTMSGKLYTVIGVMPSDFDPPRFGWLGLQELWFPFEPTPESRAWGRFLLVVGRLRDGVSLPQAREDVVGLADRRAKESSELVGWSASVVSLPAQITGEVRTSLLVLFAAVALLLLMATTNVATLTLSVMARRGHEFSVRRAIGATDNRLFRQLFTQSMLLGVLGASAGAAIAIPGVRVLVAMLPPDIPRVGSIKVDGPVWALTTAAALLSTVVFGTIAAFKGRRTGTSSPLVRETGRSSARAGGGAVVAVDIALAVALSVMAVLMARSFAGLRGVDLGFTSSGVVVARVALPASGYGSADSQRIFFERLLERVRALPGVAQAGLMSTRPFSGLASATTVRDAGVPADPRQQDPVADIRYVDAGVFRALGITLVSGELFDAQDTAAAPPRVVIGASLARTLWPSGDAVGRPLAMQLYDGITPTVAGIVRDVHLLDARTPPRPVAYLSASRFPSTVRDLVVRVDGGSEAFVPSLRAAVASIDPLLPLYAVTMLSDLVEASLARERLVVFILGAFALIALLLAGVGVFGVFAGEVTRRRKEIGIRLALGARDPGIVVMLLGQALRRVVVGVGAGMLLAALLARGMQSLLFGVGATDSLSFVGVSTIVIVLALIATLIPARRALRVSPLRSLREE